VDLNTIFVLHPGLCHKEVLEYEGICGFTYGVTRKVTIISQDFNKGDLRESYQKLFKDDIHAALFLFKSEVFDHIQIRAITDYMRLHFRDDIEHSMSNNELIKHFEKTEEKSFQAVSKKFFSKRDGKNDTFIAIKSRKYDLPKGIKTEYRTAMETILKAIDQNTEESVPEDEVETDQVDEESVSGDSNDENV